MLKQDDGQEVVMKYMLTHRTPNEFGVLCEKHIVLRGEMHFDEECETLRSYSLHDALLLAERCTNGKVLPTTYLEIEEELKRQEEMDLV